MGVAIHGAVDDVDRVGAQEEIDEGRARAFPAVELVLAHQIDEVVLLGRCQCSEGFAELGLAGALDRTERRAIKIRVRRSYIHDARFEQRLLRRNRKLLIDEIDDARVLGAGNERLAHGAQRGRLFGGESSQRNVLRLRLAWCQQNFGAADRKRERADGRALHEGAPLNLVHDFSSRESKFAGVMAAVWNRSKFNA